MSKYGELLKDPRWQKKRLEILNRDNWQCAECGALDKTLHVHHHHYEKGKLPWEYSDRALITLCHECHEAEEYYRKDNRDIALDLCYSGYTRNQVDHIVLLISYRFDELPSSDKREFINELREFTQDFLARHGKEIH